MKYTQLAAAVAQMRKKEDLTIPAAASKARCAVGSWHAWESGASLPSRRAIPDLATALGISESKLAKLVAADRSRRVHAKQANQVAAPGAGR